MLVPYEITAVAGRVRRTYGKERGEKVGEGGGGGGGKKRDMNGIKQRQTYSQFTIYARTLCQLWRERERERGGGESERDVVSIVSPDTYVVRGKKKTKAGHWY